MNHTVDKEAALDAVIFELKAKAEQAGLGYNQPTDCHFPPEPAPPEFSDESLAMDFADRHKDELRYVAAWNKWLKYSGGVWRFDDTLNVFDLARRVCREAAARCRIPRTAGALASSKTVAAIVSLARADRRIAATTDQWDTDPWLLNTPGGAVDLRTGNMRPHQSNDYCTKMTAVAPGGECPQWLDFLNRITNDDSELVAFHRRVFGYGLTGITREHAMFFHYGTGANGKSTLIGTATHVLGDYAGVAAAETFTASGLERHPTEIAGLRGLRLVTAIETEEGKRWAESKIKTLTGGDAISARFMRQDFFTFTPQFKLIVAGNHKPQLRNVDAAIQRRLHLVPFSAYIEPDQRDHRLSEKLKAESPGILAWMIEGCREWQQIGLASPACVTGATAEYFETEDSLARWLADCCDIDPQGRAESGELFASWKMWAETVGEWVSNQKVFGQRLQDRGFTPHRGQAGRRGYIGLALKCDDNAGQWWSR
ncbi:MAG: phage/plasmid primase, P4 family [Pseudomonadota bacterium]